MLSTGFVCIVSNKTKTERSCPQTTLTPPPIRCWQSVQEEGRGKKKRKTKQKNKTKQLHNISIQFLIVLKKLLVITEITNCAMFVRDDSLSESNIRSQNWKKSAIERRTGRQLLLSAATLSMCDFTVWQFYVLSTGRCCRRTTTSRIEGNLQIGPDCNSNFLFCFTLNLCPFPCILLRKKKKANEGAMKSFMIWRWSVFANVPESISKPPQAFWKQFIHIWQI